MTTTAYSQDCQIEELRAELRNSVDPMEAREIEAELRALVKARASQDDGQKREG